MSMRRTDTHFISVDADEEEAVPVNSLYTFTVATAHLLVSLTRNEKFRKSQMVLNQICDVVADCTMTDFEKHINLFNKMLTAVKQNKKYFFSQKRNPQIQLAIPLAILPRYPQIL